MNTEAHIEESLRDLADLRAAVNHHSIIAVTDPQGRITFANDKFCEISKYSREELIGQDHRIINSGYHSAQFIRGLWTTIGRGRVWHGEIRNKAKDGSFYWVDTTIVPFLDEAGRPRKYVSIRTDVTERRRAEEAAAKLAAIVEFSEDAIIGKSLQGVITSWNRGAEKIFGYASAEMIGVPITRLIPADRLDEEARIIELIGRGEVVGHFETVRLRRDGASIDVSVTVSPIRDAEGRVTGASKVARDITRQKSAEAAVKRLNSSLEQRVSERTAQLEAANHELEAFSYSVSHDLRAPLRAADGFSQAVLEDFGPVLPDEGRRYLRTIRQSTQRMGLLIDDLLAFARLSRQELSRRPVNMGELARAALEELEPERRGRAIDIEIGDLPVCMGDHAMLRQVWLNLLSNAFKYTQKRERARVEIGCAGGAEADSFFVRDNGTGFDMRYAGKLFGVFQRLHRADEYEGTGVGLAIVQRIIHRHGGRVWAEAESERGATFHFTLAREAGP